MNNQYESNQKAIETEKIFCPKNQVVFVEYDRRHRPKIKVFMGG